MMGGVGF